MDDFTSLAVGFARVLRGAGVSVPIDRVSSFANALGVLGVTSSDTVYRCARATLISRPEDFAVFDACFRSWWFSHRLASSENVPEPIHVALEIDDEETQVNDSEDQSQEVEPDLILRLRFSPNEVLASKDFAKCTQAELDEAAKAMDRIALVVPRRRTTRKIPSKTRRGAIDIKKSVKDAIAHNGEPIRVRHRVAGTRPRRIVLLCDVSGSMEPYARALIRFMHSAVAGGIRVEAFTFSTSLTRITKELNWKDPDVAMSRAGQAVRDWSGGTRIGDALRQFNEQFGIRGMARGAIVVIMSDGWDRGEPELVAREMARLSRVAQRVVWVNPLKYTPGYAPLARGMSAALPYVSDFVEGHSLGSLIQLAEVIAK
ncbi:MAG: VWA domain-containing protein [Actinomycetota bacterium]|nr:MAG: VWA domain-containing protein [Actinomycetota bacterium]